MTGQAPQAPAQAPFARWFLRRDLRRVARDWDRAAEALMALHGLDREGTTASAQPARHRADRAGRAGRSARNRARKAVRTYSASYSRAVERCTLACEAADEADRERLLALLTQPPQDPASQQEYPILPLALPLDVAIRGLASRHPQVLALRLPPLAPVAEPVRTAALVPRG